MDVNLALLAKSGLLKEAYKYYAYWKEYRGKRIAIVTQSLTRMPDMHELIVERFEIEGVVDDIMLLPIGFRLKDVKERYKTSNYSLEYIDGQPEPLVVPKGHKDMVIREVGEKIVSFSSIEQIEFVDDHNRAIEPK